MSQTKIPTFTRQEAADRLGTSYRTVVRLEERGELKACGRSGCELLYPVVAVDALKAKREARFAPARSARILTVAQAKRKAAR
jgi:excisionase family DNA binding protein